jgi:7,8-dihydropterin-6-yl-methyl-4-(beta-D-ribofuranosyl)aminobenzene 5'-phosphate synthase
MQRRSIGFLGLIFIVVILGITLFSPFSSAEEGQQMSDVTGTVHTQDWRITVLYDNNPYKDGLETAWGFACLIEGPEKTILFDTGGKGLILLTNMQKLGVQVEAIDAVVLSHEHGDHTGGLQDFLKEHPEVTLYVPKSFSSGFKEKVKSHNTTVVEVDSATTICDNVYSSGDIEGRIREQALILRTAKGLIVITGCAHPGIVKIIQIAKDLFDDDEVLLVMGGFHLKDNGQDAITDIVSDFKQLGVKYAAPTHCSGDAARTIFKEHYQDHFISIGAGAVLTLEDLLSR